MIDAKTLLADLQAQQKKLEVDLRQQTDVDFALKERLQADYQRARSAGRTADTYGEWSQNEFTQGAVAWLLACAFVRFSEDNGLLTAPMLSGPGDALRRARDAFREYVRHQPTEHERHYLEHCFRQMTQLPVVAGLFDPAHNPLFAMPLSYEAAKGLLEFWQRVNPDTGELRHDFRDPDLNTRFLGDLYQDLSEAARKRYALLQTPEFVEEFILDRTLEPAIQTFGLKGIRLIDPTCGSGHFLLGAFQRLLAHWQKATPGLDRTEHVKQALDGVYGVDLNPFAVTIARFRLLVAALKASGIRTLKESRGWTFHLTTGDSLLHGPRLGFGEFKFSDTGVLAEYAHVYGAEDWDAIHQILGQQYHAVVGNPPYITASDSALNALYRLRYTACHRKFSLGVPFTERFFQLALHNSDSPAGYVGMITADSFMKREFGKKLIEQYLPRQDLTHLIHTSGAYIPGHGTPTVILFGRNRAPVADTVRAVLGIRGEPSAPADPARGLVWSSIIELTDQPGRSNDYISVADIERTRLAKHPWSLQGGGTPAVLDQINSTDVRLGALATAVGVFGMTNADEVMLADEASFRRRRTERDAIRPLTIGDEVRDWVNVPATFAVFPYSGSSLLSLSSLPKLAEWLWPARTTLGNRATFAKKTYFEEGRPWWEWHQIALERMTPPLTITFGEVATHNHFVLDRGGKVFNRTAPVIKLPPDASEDEHLGLLGLLNSSTACFWLRQNCFGKGGDHVGTDGARVVKTSWDERFAFNATRIEQFPVSDERPLALSRQIDKLSQERAALLPVALVARLPMSRAELDAARAQSELLLERMIALQEELDWWCYHAYGLLGETPSSDGMEPGVALGERAFEIVLARRMAANEVQTTWFSRHGSTPLTELPAHWSPEYRLVVERRIALIESNAYISVLERPEYKRRWNQHGWDELEQAALKGWLLDRLETVRYWPEPTLLRVSDLAAQAERDADFMAVGALYTAQPAFNVPALVRALLQDESVPALSVLRYKDSGLRKRADWEDTWDQQRKEDEIDVLVATEHRRFDDLGETEIEWQARIKPEQSRRKHKEVGDLPAPPKYVTADFLSSTYWRLRGGLDVPKERFFSVPDPVLPGEWLYGWAGWNPAQRVRAIAGSYIQIEHSSGVDVAQLLPLLVALQEELPWVFQWHNALDREMDVRPGDYFRSWLSDELNRHGWTHKTLLDWRPGATARGRGARKA